MIPNSMKKMNIVTVSRNSDSVSEMSTVFDDSQISVSVGIIKGRLFH